MGGDAEASHEVAMHHHSHNGRSHPHDHAMSPKGLVIDAVLELNGEWQAKQTISGETTRTLGAMSSFCRLG